jgi:hypothetical protein
MAGDWIKMRCNLWDDPRVGRICDLTGHSEAAVVGGLYWLWAMADQHSTDGLVLGLSVAQINRKTGLKDFGEALCEIGWIDDRATSIVIERFDEHNGASAKKRCQTAKRVASHRSGNDEETADQDACNAVSVTGALAREDKREEVNTPPTPKGVKQVAPCPYEAIFEAYEQALPELPRVRLRDDEKRRTAIRKRWQWVCTSTKSDGTRRAETVGDAVQWFREFFKRASHNDWLMGRRPSASHPDFKANFDFLLKDAGWKAVIERTEVAA